jgi:GTP cyclohydrolase I
MGPELLAVQDSANGEADAETEKDSQKVVPTRKRARMEAAVRTLLECLGEDPEREGLVDTPKRVAKALLDCTCGYSQTAAELVGSAIFKEESCGDIVIVRDIPVHSLCEHHMLPFTGKAHVAYIPDGNVIGLSKIGRIVDMYSRRLQVQERLTHQVRRHAVPGVRVWFRRARARLRCRARRAQAPRLSHPRARASFAPADRGRARGAAGAKGRGRDHRVHAHVHGDARRPAARRDDGDARAARLLARRRAEAQRFHAPAQPIHVSRAHREHLIVRCALAPAIVSRPSGWGEEMDNE